VLERIFAFLFESTKRSLLNSDHKLKNALVSSNLLLQIMDNPKQPAFTQILDLNRVKSKAKTTNQRYHVRFSQ
jgi:hypothetical protein